MKSGLLRWSRHLGVTLCLSATVVGSSWGAPVSPPSLEISQVPLFLGGLVQPSIMLTLDDSASMGWSFMPDSAGSLVGTRQGLAAQRNWIAYNPAVAYAVPYGVPTQPPTFGAAWDDGYRADSAIVNLAGSDVDGDGTVEVGYVPSWQTGVTYADPEPTKATGRAYYYLFDPSAGGCLGGDTEEKLADDLCYTRVEVAAAEEQNFANWYSYYRTRLYVAKAAAAIAVGEFGQGGRLGLASVNTVGTILEGVDLLGDSHRGLLLDALFGLQAAGGTPLRTAADDVGKYFQTAEPWRKEPTSDDSAEVSCRRAYHVLMSDGYWNGAPANAEESDPNARSNNDGTDGPTIPPLIDPITLKVINPSYTYEAVSPFTDGVADTLADVAMYYWKNDLRPNLTNNVPQSTFNPAYWQHLITVAIGLGLEDPDPDNEHVDPDEAFAAIFSGDTIEWPDPEPASGTESPFRLDDFLHAAVNSRGEFTNMTSPEDLLDTLGRIVASIPGRAASSASVVLNSGALRSDTRLYQARFNSADWTGQLLAYEVKDDGSIGVSPLWDAGTKISSTGRKIATTQYSNSNGAGSPVAFTWDELSADQRSALGGTSVGPDVVAYLRGSDAGEIANGGVYRNRSRLLGDIINSAPAYLGPPVTMYPDFWANTDINDNTDAPENAAPYSAFRADNKDRDEIIYVGANDGMLHAFDADSGDEVFAFVPGYVVRNLKQLTNPAYSDNHRYYVDGSPTVGDAFFGGAWHTVLVAGLGAGGQGIYALDVTDASAANEAAVVDKVLWEFTDADNSDVGYQIGQPNIVRAPVGKGAWVAMFGNGYNSTYADGAASKKGNAILFAVYLDGSKVTTWDTQVGASDDPLKQNRANGLASVAPVDINGDFTVDYAYAGDLFGNLWRFDFSTNKVTKLFTAKDGLNNPQPITTRPAVMRHPTLGGAVVLFGTGKYFENEDSSAVGQPTQSFYAIWDKDPADTSPVIPTVVRGNSATSQLLQQEIIEEVDPIDGIAYRVTTDNAIEWKQDSAGKHYGWFIDLVNTEGGNTSNFGERQVSDSLVRQGKIIFTTLIPSANACDFGGSGWLMELDAADGGRPSFAFFDLNKDGVFSVDDYVEIADGNNGTTEVPPTGRKSAVGIVPMPAILSRPGGEKEYKYMSGSTGQIDVVAENPGDRTDFARQSWQQHFAP